MSEIILPGTYISVRDEALITAGRVATGNIGIVGTASKGDVEKVILLSSFSEAREVFGEGGESVTLIPALEKIFNNGGRTVYAVRVAKDPSPATFWVTANDVKSVEISAKTKGSWGNNISINIEEADESAIVEDYLNRDNTNIRLHRNTIDKESRMNNITVIRKGDSIGYQIVYDKEPDNGQVSISTDVTSGGALTFNPILQDEDRIIAVYQVPKGRCRKITLKYKEQQLEREEKYLVADAAQLITYIRRNRSSFLSIDEEISESDLYNVLPDVTVQETNFTKGSDGTLGVSATEYSRGLELLNNPKDFVINIVLLAGQDARDEGGMLAALKGHLKSASENKGERIGVIGGSSDVRDTLIHEIGGANSDRLIFVAPGIQEGNKQLSAAYTAAAIAGLISSLPVQASPTNKQVVVAGLSKNYTTGELEQLVTKNMLVVEKREGYRIVKGITTASNTAWHQITTRRIVDYALYGVRSACNPYIGKLNNERVRGAMKATIDAFLTRMVNDEALISYELEVSATRAQEIAGECIVTMTIRPTFSIDFIMVTMYLG